MGSVLPWLGEAVVPHFVSDIELIVTELLVVVGFTTFCLSLKLLLREGESHSQVRMQLFQALVSGIGGDEIQIQVNNLLLNFDHGRGPTQSI